MIESTEVPADDVGEETYGMYLRRVSGTGHKQPVRALELALESVGHKVQEVTREGAQCLDHVWYTDIFFKRNVPVEDVTTPLYVAFSDALQRIVIERAKHRLGELNTLSSSLANLREWISITLPKWLAGETANGVNYGTLLARDHQLRVRLSFIVAAPLREEDAPSWLTVKAEIARVVIIPLNETNFHPSTGEAEERTVVAL